VAGIESAVLLRLGSGAALEEIRCVVDPAHASQLTRDEITAAVHYVRIALSPEQAKRFAADEAVLVVDHPRYAYAVELAPATKAALVEDW